VRPRKRKRKTTLKKKKKTKKNPERRVLERRAPLKKKKKKRSKFTRGGSGYGSYSATKNGRECGMLQEFSLIRRGEKEKVARRKKTDTMRQRRAENVERVIRFAIHIRIRNNQVEQGGGNSVSRTR